MLEHIKTPGCFAEDCAALADQVAEAAAQVQCLPLAHKATDIDPADATRTRTMGKKAEMEPDGKSRKAPDLDYSGIEAALAYAEKVHDTISAAIIKAGLDPEDERVHFVRDVVRRRQRAAAHPAAQLDQDVNIAIRALTSFGDMLKRRNEIVAAQIAKAAQAPAEKAGG